MVDFGTDISCFEDMDPQASEVSGYELLAQAVFRRITTPRGMLIDDEDYGIDVRSLLHKGMTEREIAAFPGVVRQEILKDERIARCTVELKRTTIENWQMTIVAEAGEGPFSLVVGVADAAVSLLSVAGGGE